MWCAAASSRSRSRSCGALAWVARLGRQTRQAGQAQPAGRAFVAVAPAVLAQPTGQRQRNAPRALILPAPGPIVGPDQLPGEIRLV